MLIHLKEDNISVNDAIEDLNDRFSNEGDKLSDTEKTALNVITLLGKWVCLWPYMVPYSLLYNYGLNEKLISIIIKLRKGYFPEVRRTE
jgi:hypothetical protein